MALPWYLPEVLNFWFIYVQILGTILNWTFENWRDTSGSAYRMLCDINTSNKWSLWLTLGKSGRSPMESEGVGEGGSARECTFGYHLPPSPIIRNKLCSTTVPITLEYIPLQGHSTCFLLLLYSLMGLNVFSLVWYRRPSISFKKCKIQTTAFCYLNIIYIIYANVCPE